MPTADGHRPFNYILSGCKLKDMWNCVSICCGLLACLQQGGEQDSAQAKCVEAVHAMMS